MTIPQGWIRIKPHNTKALGAISPLFLSHHTPLMDFTQHQFQQQAAAIQSQLLSMKERLDSLEQARSIDQPLMIITHDGNVIPWTDQPLINYPFCVEFKVSLGPDWISGLLSLDKAQSLIKACLAARLEGKQVFDVGAFLNG